MNRSREYTISYGVLMVLLAVLMPWNATSAATFAPRAMVAVVVAIIGYVLARIGFMLFRRTAQTSSRDSRADPGRGLAGGLWGSLKLSCLVSLAIGLASIMLSTARLIGPIDAFFTALIAQQVMFAVFELIVTTRQARDARLDFRAAAAIAMAGLAVFFAWASKITLLAQKPPIAPPIPGSTRILFAIPAVIAGIVGLALRYRLEHRQTHHDL